MDGYANNWDLHAVVRGCSPSYPTFDPTFRGYLPCNFTTNEEDEIGDHSLFFPDLATDANAVRELEEVCRPFVAGSERQVSRPENHHHRRPSGTPRSRRRKNQQKVVCQVPAEDGHRSDMWAWRKYGQKPIKGSPFPRGYYKCSSSKGCSARKQMERNRTDPTTLIITYTGDHNHPVPTHRNSLAGSTRTKFPPPPSSKDDGDQNLDLDLDSDDGTLAKFGLSPTTPLMGATEEDDLLMPKDDHEEEVMINLKDGIEEDDFLNEFLRSMWQNESSAGSSCS